MLIFATVFLSTVAHVKEPKRSHKNVVKQWYLEQAQSGPVQLIVSLPDQKMNVYRNGQHIVETRISSGRPGHSTPGGVFSILEKRREHYSNLYDWAPMPHMQRLTWSGVALHGGNVSRGFASHGCIRLPFGFAKKLFRYTKRGAHVIIAHERTEPKVISHKNLINPQQRLVPISESAQSKPVKILVNLASASKPLEKAKTTENSGNNEQSIVKYKLLRTEAEAKLKTLLDQKKQSRLAVNGFKKQLKKQKIQVRESWKSYQKTNKKSAGLEYKHKKILKQIKWAEDRALKAKKSAEITSPKTLAWLAASEKKYAKLEGELLDLKVELTSLKEAHDGAQAGEQGIAKIKKKISALTYKQTRVLKKLSRAEKNINNVQKAIERQRDKAKAWVEKTEAKLADITHKFDLLIKDYEPLRKKRDEAKLTYESEQKKEQNIIASLNALKKTLVSLGRDIKLAREDIRKQKKPLRILLTRPSRQKNVKDIQQSLVDLGFALEKVDGLYGRETIGVIKQFQKANGLKVSGLIDDELLVSLRKKLGKAPMKPGHIYVRQGFSDIFDAPIDILNPEKPLGTHFYTALNFSKKDSQARWTVVSLKRRDQLNTKQSKPLVTGSIPERAPEQSTALDALDRIKLPEKVRAFLSKRLTPGSSLVISDKGHSHETGRGTDFIVLTR